VTADAQIIARFINQTRFRLAAVAVAFKLGNLTWESLVRMVRAKVESVEECTTCTKLGLQPGVDAPQLRKADITARNYGLVSDNHGQRAAAVEAADGLSGTGQQLDLIRRIEMTNFTVNGAVTIKENSTPELTSPPPKPPMAPK
jgi:hypothetical protein